MSGDARGAIPRSSPFHATLPIDKSTFVLVGSGEDRDGRYVDVVIRRRLADGDSTNEAVSKGWKLAQLIVKLHGIYGFPS